MNQDSDHIKDANAANDFQEQTWKLRAELDAEREAHEATRVKLAAMEAKAG